MSKIYNLNELVYEKICKEEQYISFEYIDISGNLIKGVYQGGTGIDGLLDCFGYRFTNAIEDECELPPIDKKKPIQITIVPAK